MALWGAVRGTPLWEAICFTQTGQRSGELTANSDQVNAQEGLTVNYMEESFYSLNIHTCLRVHQEKTFLVQQGLNPLLGLVV